MRSCLLVVSTIAMALAGVVLAGALPGVAHSDPTPSDLATQTLPGADTSAAAPDTAGPTASGGVPTASAAQSTTTTTTAPATNTSTTGAGTTTSESTDTQTFGAPVETSPSQQTAGAPIKTAPPTSRGLPVTGYDAGLAAAAGLFLLLGGIGGLVLAARLRRRDRGAPTPE
jgi:hypothetical protein